MYRYLYTTIFDKKAAMSDLIRQIPKGMENPWSVRVNGIIQQDISNIQIDNPKFGRLSFGLRPEGTIGWMWKEVGGGGRIIFPYAVIDNKLYIGLLLQERHAQGGYVWNVPRGFLDPAKTHFESALAELKEEVGYKNPGEKFRELKGEHANCNSSFVDSREGGDRYFAFEVFPEELKRYHDFIDVGESDTVENIYKTYKFIPGLFKPISTTAERITACLFFPWEKAATVSDLFSNAIGRLLVTFPGLKASL